MNDSELATKLCEEIGNVRDDTLSLYQSGFLTYQQHEQIAADLSNARTRLAWAVKTHNTPVQGMLIESEAAL